MLLLNLVILPSNGQVYAKCDPVTGDYDGYTYNAATGCEMIPNLTPTESISTEVSTTPTASLSIDGKTSVEDKINSSYGVTNYASHTVSVSVTEAGSYSLILSGPAQLGGPSTINATAGATGTNLANDTWGYAWENTSVADANASYKALGSSINLAGNALNNRAASFSKKLVFAAKFDKATAGIYHADVKLSLVATPEYTTTTVQYVPWDKMVYMQDMSSYACESVSIGTGKSLKDIRDNITYSISKLNDGRCWMAGNLKLSSDTMKTGLGRYLRPTDSDVSIKHQIPVSTADGFSADPTIQQIRSDSENPNDPDYLGVYNTGAYYSWCAATANTCQIDGTPIASGNATGSVCPKGWRLPTGNDFSTLVKVGYSDWTHGGNTMGRYFGSTNTTYTAGSSFFKAVGYVNQQGSGGLGSRGMYWSSSPHGDAGRAQLLDFTDYIVESQGALTRADGYSVRCVAK